MQVTLDGVLCCPEDTHTPLTYLLISHRRAYEEVWQDQITGKASLQTQRAGDTPGEQGRLWHSPISCSLMELPIELHSIRAGLVTLMSKEALCWQGCWQPLSTCHYYHTHWNRYNVYFTVLFLSFNVAILCQKYCTLLSLKLDWNIRRTLHKVHSWSVPQQKKLQRFLPVFLRYRKDPSALSVAIFCFVVGNTHSVKKRT